MKNIVEVKGVRFGEGMPKICIPLVAITLEELLEKAEEVKEEQFDLVEVRMDFIPKEFYQKDLLKQTFKQLQHKISQPILATFRSKGEGGEQEISLEEYQALYTMLIEENMVDMVDFEMFLGEELVKGLISMAKEKGTAVILSNHEFHTTPSKEEIKGRLCKMKEIGGDLCKIAVMPSTKEEVFRLIQSTYELSTERKDMLLVTMSMGKLGVVSRMIGELTGSVMTFASFGKASAPGQISLGELSKILSLLH